MLVDESTGKETREWRVTLGRTLCCGIPEWMTRVGGKVGDGKSIGKRQPWGQRKEVKHRSGLERRNPFCKSLGNPEGSVVVAPFPGAIMKGRCGQDLARGREGVLRHWVGIGWESGFLGTVPQTSRTGRRSCVSGFCHHPWVFFQAVFPSSVICLSICPSTHIATSVSMTKPWQQTGSPLQPATCAHLA